MARGWLKVEERKSGKMWVLRFKTTRKTDGKRVEHKVPVGLVREFPSKSSARKEVQRQHLNVNTPDFRGAVKFSDRAEHYIQNELGDQSDADLCSLAGTVTDPQGAVVRNATITITNADTKQTRTLTTNDAGQYEANDLHIGRYLLTVVATGFSGTVKNDIVLKAGDRQRADVVLQVYDPGCCEYAASPLKAQEEVDWIAKRKPFTYVVGDAQDHNSFQGIAKLVYGDQKMWVQIFEANRDVVETPGFIPYGKSILVPPTKRAAPKLLSKVMPVYPPEARREQVWGDVVMDVTLYEDGSVEQVNIIDGPALLVEAATTAVKQWRYHPLRVKGKRVLKFVVVVSFGKGGKIK